MKNLLRHGWCSFAFCAAIALGALPFLLATHAAVTEAWVQKYDRTGFASGVVVDKRGDIIVTGIILERGNDFYTAKYSGVNGALLWEVRYDGPTNLNDIAYSIVLDQMTTWS